MTNDCKPDTSLYKLNIPSYVFSSTPVKKNREGLTKSVGALHKTWENSAQSNNQTNELYNNNSDQKRFSLDLNILKRMNNGACRHPESENLLKEEQSEIINPEESTSNDLELEIMKELNKLKLIENGNINEQIENNELGKLGDKSHKSKTKSSESEDSNQAGGHEFFDTEEHRGFDCEYECYWDAEDEKYDNDDSY